MKTFVAFALVALVTVQAPSPELFGRGVISTELDELNAAFTPDGQELYYSINAPDSRWGVIVVSRLRNGQWTAPEVASFSGGSYTDYDPFVSLDGKQLFFISTRAKGPTPNAPGDFDIWVVNRQGSGWGEARNLGAPINTERPEYYPSVATDGTIYFSSNRDGGQGGFDVWRSKLVNGQYQAPENLGPAVNSSTGEIDTYIAADQSYLVFAGYNRTGAPGGGDLYISFFENGAWTPARLLGSGINSPAREYCPIGSPDGQFFYWTSKRGFVDTPRQRALTGAQVRDSLRGVLNGQGNIYRIPVAALRS